MNPTSTRTQPLHSGEAPLVQPHPGPDITPELVRKIADQVYAELLRDLALERERSKRSTGMRRQ